MKKVLAILLLMIAMTAFAGCGTASDTDYVEPESETTTVQQTEADPEDEEFCDGTYCVDPTEYSYDGEQTAPMPDELLVPHDITGRWVDDPNAERPKTIDIKCQDGALRYRYYKVELGNESGLNYANETTEWEYCAGIVNLHGNWGSFDCMVQDGDSSYISFYYIDSETIADQVTGDYFYKIK